LNASKHDRQLEDVLQAIKDKCNNGTLRARSKTADIFTFNNISNISNISNLNFVPSDPHELPSISKLSTPELAYLSARGMASLSSVGNPGQPPGPSEPINGTNMPISALNDSLLTSNPLSSWKPSSFPRPNKSRCNNFCYIQLAAAQNPTPLSTSKEHGSEDQRIWDLLMQFGSSPQQQGINSPTPSKQPDKEASACRLLECSKSFSCRGNY
jgi:hypothetical protein